MPEHNIVAQRAPEAAGVAPARQVDDDPDGSSRVVVAGQWKLMWWKFRKHKLAVIGGIITLLFYFVAVFATFFAPFPGNQINARYTYAPPQGLTFFRDTDHGREFGLFVHGYKVTIDQAALRRVYVVDPAKSYPIGLFVHGAPHTLLGFIETDLHFIGPLHHGDPMYLFGADRLGRDVLSRIIIGTQISMSVGLVGVALSLFLGLILGGVSGYYGGAIDTLVQRLIEFLQSIPSIPLWMGLAAAIPPTISPVTVYFFIVAILSVVGWTELGRAVRGKFLALKTEDFVVAARLDGCSTFRVIMRHMVPSFMSHIVAVVTLAIPSMILAETSLSFLGIGLRAPVISWGVLLQEAQNLRAVATAPWLLLPAGVVIVAVLALNFLGDGLRDASDPYNG